MKKLFIFAILFSSLSTVFAQNNTDYADRMEHVFGNIDKTKVTTGFLKEFGIRFNQVEAYNGIINSNNLVDKTQWQSLYSSLYTMRVGTVAQNMDAPALVFDNLNSQQQNSNDDVLLALLYYNYQQYKTNAYTNGDVTVNNDQIFDVPGRNPYETKKVFALSPLKKSITGNSFTFKLPSNLVYTNAGLLLYQVQIDFDDGNGYQTVNWNTSKTVNYTSGGEKELKIKMIFNRSTVLYSHSKIWVDYITTGGQQARFNNTGTDTYVITGEAWQGSTATGLVTVETAGTDGVLDKPLIVVEGFDPDNSFNYNDLVIQNTQSPGSFNIPLGDGLTLNQAIEDEGYDLVFINFANGTDYIQRNAYMVEEVIDTINAMKQGNEKNAVLGMSMGGLVARYALRHMEIDNDPATNHDTKLYISHDAPHQGANMPLAYQALVRHLVGEEITLPVFFSLIDVDIIDIPELIPDLEEGLALLQTPAAKQMLAYQLQGTGNNVTVNGNSLQEDFSTEYSSMGYPQQNGIRNIAIANGSECGTPLGFDAYDTLFNVNEKFDLPYVIGIFKDAYSFNPLKFISSVLSTDTDVKMQFNGKALPNQQVKRIYRGKLYIEKEVLFVIDIHEPLIDEENLYSNSSLLPLDNNSGGIYNIEEFAPLPPEMDDYLFQNQFNFVPTYSSLDIGSGNQNIYHGDLTAAYSPLSPPISPKNVPFDNFYTNPLQSESHIQYTLNNGQWLMDELMGNEAFYSCSVSCQQKLNAEITGSDFLCSTTNYNITDLAPGRNIVWSISPSYAATLTDNSTNVSLDHNPNFNGSFTLTASIQTDCEDLVLNKEIWSGPPILSANVDCFANPSHEDCDAMCQSFSYLPENTIGITVNGESGWELENLTNNFVYYIGPGKIYIQPYESGFIAFNIKAENPCGYSDTLNYMFSVDDCTKNKNHQFSIYPNPSNEIINIDLIQAGTSTSGSTTSTGSEVYSSVNTSNSSAALYDYNGNLIVTLSPAVGSMDVQSLTPGNYILIISYGNETEAHHIVIN